jgi:hypothetical protein
MPKALIKEFEVVSHGFEHSDYFQGYSAVGTNYRECVTGCGSNELEAFNDALDSIAQSDFNINVDQLEKDILKENEFSEEDSLLIDKENALGDEPAEEDFEDYADYEEALDEYNEKEEEFEQEYNKYYYVSVLFNLPEKEE